MKATPWGVWDSLTVDEFATVLEPLAAPWWIAGGYALEAFVGNSWREHDDIDAAVFRDDHLELRRVLRDWDVHVADPPGSLRPWHLGERLPVAVHDIWVRRHAADAWRFQFMLDERDGDEWVFRRDGRVRLPVGEITWERGGIRFVQPEIQLLYKSRGRRDKDEADFRVVLPLLSTPQRAWLRDALLLSDPGNPWLAKLA
jgi:hypothetical protein